MDRQFGQQIDSDLDLAREKRRDRVRWLLFATLIFCGIYLFSGGRFETEVFQGLIATVLPYGSTFYADRKYNIRGTVLWKAVVATVPIHAAYLFGMFYCDVAFPRVMTKAIVFIPLLAIGFGIESALIFDRIVVYFASNDRGPSDPSAKQAQA